MVLYRKAPIDFSTFPDSDGEPVAETRANFAQAADMIYSAEHHLAPQVRFVVGGGQFIYYDPTNGRRHVSPDVYIALDVAPGWRAKWQTWEEGKFPEIVMEFVSPSTQDEDLGVKVALYGELGAREYYIYDPAHLLEPPLRAYHRVGRRLVAEPPLPGPDLAVYSPALGTELRVVGQWLRLIDPVTGEPYSVPEEDYAALQAISVRLTAEEHARERAEEQARRDAAARSAAEERVKQEAAARHEAESALAAALAELARLHGERPAPDDDPLVPPDL